MNIFFVTVNALLLVQVSYVYSWDRPSLANPGQYPHEAILEWTGPPPAPTYHGCGGAIIANIWILSSGYCLADIRNLSLVVYKVGSHDVLRDDQFVQRAAIERVIVHDKYPLDFTLRNLGSYDIGLAKLKKALTFSDRVKAIKLPKGDGFFTGKVELNYNLVLTGWGQVARGIVQLTSNVLSTVNLPIVSNKICQESIQQNFNWIQLTDSQICTRPLDGTATACVGDYGGPLIQYDRTNTPEIVGVRTWSMIPCNTNSVPPVYARVPYFVKWINKQMK